MSKSNHYWTAIAQFKTRLREAIPVEELRELHVNKPAMHLAYAFRQFAIIGVCGWGLWHFTNPLIWVPLAILQGFTFFNMTTLLHEVVHQSVFRHGRPGWERVLGLVYASTSGISASQFTSWHLDHHDNLGSDEDDPKRHWLSPKRNARWYKLLYCTPLLMPLYFRAAASEVATYPAGAAPPDRVRAARHHGAAVLRDGRALLLRRPRRCCCACSSIPYFFVFPVAFCLNRLGQHYNIDPTHPLKWATLMKPSRLWDFLFVYSNYHLEHHYFPRVPFYNLRKLHMRLRPLYAELGLKPHTYRRDRLAMVRAEPRAAHQLGTGRGHPDRPRHRGGHASARPLTTAPGRSP